ncbi:Ger(x)C family spore germination protein [Aneurinibacillus sp. Ricciae_BoGa-3]|uniref:Ger(x)C family spore germination protein n=1 Tax=Aneurinibacillus sp. Ricciae_BoGa-3 TaxID=3022697 RepID=UPI002341BFE2|nr:Ger(x)C family spore germination protein [Aneurinibacillus sp. Ricciae_BoGa-3]WCK54546.1 Ger(x)C family spore germination protein [Aneurinibacillus sp. Ricciae_BoGa-3]
MKRIGLLLIIFLLSLIFLTGCWDRRELNELAIVTAAGIDKVGNQYEVTVQLVNPSEVAPQKKGGGGGGQVAVTTYQAKGDTLFKAIRRISTIAPRQLYFSHLQMLVIGEKVAKDGIRKVLDLFSRNYQVRTDFYIAITSEKKASDILKILTPVEKTPSQNMYTKLETSNKIWAATGTKKLDELISDLIAKGKDPVLTRIKIIGSEKQGNIQDNLKAIDSPARLEYYGVGVFKEDQLVGWLNEDETKGWNYLRNGGVKGTVVEFPCPKKEKAKANVELIRTKTETKGRVKNGKPIIDVTFRAEGNVGEVQCEDLDLTQTKTIHDLEKRTEQDIRGKIEKALKKARKLEADIFGFGEIIHRADPRSWKKMKNHWREQKFADTAVHVYVKVYIRRVGSVNNSFLKKME